ncbi:sugar transferase [Sulfitobacter sp. SK012]|uniref:sugar transferase n=1 Tax=Sulfitobacter sp. SK012 TaxID=1389005 RepID=UPI0026719A9B|nr:sugar transferase [Sulfitobacter sp. SK012]
MNSKFFISDVFDASEAASIPVLTQRPSKRLFDVFLILLASPLVLPAGILIVMLIKLDGGGAALFGHRRFGRRGEPFNLLKFRTMVVGAEELKLKLLDLNEAAWPDFKITNDPRVTRIGRFLRKTSLDELPQLLNVLRGEMSLIGPRASSVPLERYENWQLPRLSVLPGIAGPAQLFQRNGTFSDRCRLDLEYIATSSLWTDLRLCLQVVGKIIFAPDGK